MTPARPHALSVRLSTALFLAVALFVTLAVREPVPAQAADPACGFGRVGSTSDGGLVLCVDAPDDTRLVQQVNQGTYALDQASYDALSRLEDLAVERVSVLHGVSALDAELVRRHARAEVRASMMTQLVAAAAKPVEQRTPDERRGLFWLTQVQQRQNVAIADAAIEEYRRFYGANAFTDPFPLNACTYQPPAPFEDDYPGDAGPWQGCRGPVTNPLDLGPRIPTVDDFTKWGGAVVEAQRYGQGEFILQSLATQQGLAAAALSGVVGLGTGALVAVNSVTASAITTAIFPYALWTQSAAVAGATSALVPASAQSFLPAVAAAGETAAATGPASTAAAPAIQAAGVSAGTVVGAAAIVIVGLTLVVLSLIKAITNAGLGQALRDARQRAVIVPVPPEFVVNTPQGVDALTVALQEVTSSTAVADAVRLPAPPQRDAGDPVLAITTAAGAPVTGRTSTWSYRGVTGADQQEAQTRLLRGGFLLDPRPDVEVVSDPTLSVVAPLWDPEPLVGPGGVTTDRPGFDFPAQVSLVRHDGRTRWQAVVLDRPDYPKPGTDCDDFAEDGCWITDALPFYAPGTVAGRRLATMVANAAPAPGGITGGTGPLLQGDPVRLAVRDTDPDGDAVTVRWTAERCAPVCQPVALDGITGGPQGAEVTVHFPDTGAYRVRATATDAFGLSTNTMLPLTVGNRAPRIAFAPSTATTVPQGSAWDLVATVSDGPSEQVSVTTDWGDGTSPTTQPLPVPGTSLVRASRTWTQPGARTVRLTATDGTATSAAEVQVAVTDVVPAVAAAPEQPTTPASLLDLEPATTVTVRGVVTDPGTEDRVELLATWYDGTTQRFTVPASGTARRSFSTSHTVRAPAVHGSTLVRVAPAGGGSAGLTLKGSVQDTAPELSSLLGVPGAVGGASVLTGTASDRNGGGVPVFVDWGDGTEPVGATVAPDGTFRVEHVYTSRGAWEAQVGAGLAPSTTSATVPFVVGGTAPVIGPVTAPAPVVEGAPADLEIELADGQGDAGSLDVAWGDGTSETVTYAAGATQVRVRHTWAQDGRFDVVVTPTDVDGPGAARSLAGLVVADAVPRVLMPTEVSLARGATLRLADLPVVLSDAGLQDVGTLVVDWGDGSTPVSRPWSADQPVPDLSHAYTTAGDRVLTVTVTDARTGAVGSARTTVRVSTRPTPPAPAARCLNRAATVVAAAGQSVVRGTEGNDVIVAGTGAETVLGLGGNDLICAGAGVDRVRGGSGNDVVLAEAGNDTLSGDDGDDILVGGSGDDLLEGGAGRDLLLGGSGTDRFVGVTRHDFAWQ